MAVKNVTFEVIANTAKATASLNALIQQLAAIQKNATIKVNVNAQGAAQQATALKSTINSLPAQKKVQFQTNAQQATQQVGGITKGVNAVSQAVANSSTNFVRLRNVIARTGLALSGVAIGAAITSLGRAAIKASSDYEVLKVAFTTFIGNAELAEVKIRSLREFAAETPFTVDEVFKASRTLLGYGVAAGELIPIIKRLGDVAGGTGAPLERIALVFGQVRAAGRLYGQDLLQLINAGFNPLQEISRTTGKSFGQLKDEMRKGLVTFEDVNQAFITATSEGGKFFNLTNALANTTQGRLARLSESWTELLRVLGDGLLPTFNAVVVSATKVVVGLKELPEVIEKNKVSILLLTSATALFVGIRTKANQANILAAVTTAADNVVERVSNTLYRTKNALLLGTTRLTVGMTVAQRAQTVATNIGTVAQNAFNVAVRANPLGLILTILAAATAAWYAYGDSVGEAADDWIDLNDVIAKSEAETIKGTDERLQKIRQERDLIKQTTSGSKERQELLAKFNKENKTNLQDLQDEKQFVNNLDAAYAGLKVSIEQQEKAKSLTAGQDELAAQKAVQIEKLQKQAREQGIDIPINLFSGKDNIENNFKEVRDFLLKEEQKIQDDITFINSLSGEERLKREKELLAQGFKLRRAQYTDEEGSLIMETVDADTKAYEQQANAIQNKLIPSLNQVDATQQAIAGVQVELNELPSIIPYDPTADDAKAEADKKRLQQYKDYLNEYFSLLDRIRKNNEDFRKQSIEFQFIDAANFEEEVAKLRLLDKINEETVNRQIDREIESVRLKDLTEQQKNDLITQLEIIRGQEQQARAFDLQDRIYEIERDGTLARRKLALELNDLYNDIASDRLKKELDSLNELRTGFEDFYNDIFEDNPFAKGRFIKAPLFGDFGFQFEDVEADIEGLKRGLQQITQFSPGDLFDDTTQGARIELIDEFNKKYGTTIKLTEDELGLQEELSKAYSDIQKKQEALAASQKKVGIFRFAKQIIEEGANDPFKLGLEDSRREYFTKLDEDFKLTEKGLIDARNAAATEFRTLYEGNIIEKADADAQLLILDTKLQEDIKKAEDETDQAKKDRLKEDIKANEDRVQQLKDIIKEERDARLQALEDIKDAFLDFQKVFIDGQIQQTEAAISAQEKRVQAAQEIADRGNVVLLKAEQERLDKLNRQRASFVRQQQNLAAVEIAVNSAVAVAKAAGQPGSPFTIFAILAAMAVGFAQARAQAQSAATFAKGGYTGDGHQFQEAGTVHKGEFVMNAQKTRQYRPLLEAIHAGRNPKALQSVQDRMLIVNSQSTDERLERIERAIIGQKGMQLSIDENGINGIVSRITYKQQRINNRAR
jgi:tape measure domain-containing protein